MDIETFYDQDERRRRSEEVELGTDWHDADGARYELGWVADTGELYVMREPTVPMSEDPFGDVFRSPVSAHDMTVAVVGHVANREDLERLTTGWEEAMGQSESISWLVKRLGEQAVPRVSPDA